MYTKPELVVLGDATSVIQGQKQFQPLAEGIDYLEVTAAYEPEE